MELDIELSCGWRRSPQGSFQARVRHGIWACELDQCARSCEFRAVIPVNDARPLLSTQTKAALSALCLTTEPKSDESRKSEPVTERAAPEIEDF